MPKNKKKVLTFLLPIALVVIGAIAFIVTRGSADNQADAGKTPAPTIKPRVNIIALEERPYVTLEPLPARNELSFTVHNLPKTAEEVEVLLEYDRNKGVMDAVLKMFNITAVPYQNKLFMGSKSAGGHTTYHDDVIGGKLIMNFSGSDDYSLEVPWRYDDTQARYTQLATADLAFQLTLDQPWRTSKVVIMQSPGLPIPTSGEVIAGPYVVRGVGAPPSLTGTITIRLPEAEMTEAKLAYFDGEKWQPVESTLDRRTLTATKVPLASVYVVTK